MYILSLVHPWKLMVCHLIFSCWQRPLAKLWWFNLKIDLCEFEFIRNKFSISSLYLKFFMKTYVGQNIVRLIFQCGIIHTVLCLEMYRSNAYILLVKNHYQELFHNKICAFVSPLPPMSITQLWITLNRWSVYLIRLQIKI